MTSVTVALRHDTAKVRAVVNPNGSITLYEIDGHCEVSTWNTSAVPPAAQVQHGGECSRNCMDTMSCDNSCRHAGGEAVAFIAQVKEARRVWMKENPCEDGRDHVTPFDRFLYTTPPVAQVQQEADRG